MHGLTASQLSELQGAMQWLNVYLMCCVDGLRNNRGNLDSSKHKACCGLSGLQSHGILFILLYIFI